MSSRAIFLLLDVQQIFTPSKRRLVGSYFSATRRLVENFYQTSSTKSSTRCLVEQKIWAIVLSYSGKSYVVHICSMYVIFSCLLFIYLLPTYTQIEIMLFRTYLSNIRFIIKNRIVEYYNLIVYQYYSNFKKYFEHLWEISSLKHRVHIKVSMAIKQVLLWCLSSSLAIVLLVVCLSSSISSFFTKVPNCAIKNVGSLTLRRSGTLRVCLEKNCRTLYTCFKCCLICKGANLGGIRALLFCPTLEVKSPPKS